jgi:SAM-dependent methyltransferase
LLLTDVEVIMAEPTDVRAWEEAETARSYVEATQTPIARLRASESNIRRYLDPPSSTPYPLEYAFYLIGNVAGKTVLDYGCGSGENSIVLVRRKARVVGLDVSDALLDLARKRLALNGLAGQATFIAGSAHDIPLPDESVDVVLGIAILHHLDLDRAASEINRVLRRGGKAVFQEPVRNSRVIKTIRAMIPYRSKEVSPYERPLTDDELDRFSRSFQTHRSRVFSLPFINLAQVVPALKKQLLALYRIDGAILKRAPALNRYAGIRVFELIKSS